MDGGVIDRHEKPTAVRAETRSPDPTGKIGEQRECGIAVHTGHATDRQRAATLGSDVDLDDLVLKAPARARWSGSLEPNPAPEARGSRPDLRRSPALVPTRSCPGRRSRGSCALRSRSLRIPGRVATILSPTEKSWAPPITHCNRRGPCRPCAARWGGACRSRPLGPLRGAFGVRVLPVQLGGGLGKREAIGSWADFGLESNICRTKCSSMPLR